MVDVFIELLFLWISVGLVMPILACIAYENIRLHRIHMRMNRTVLDTDTTGRVNTVPLPPVLIQVRPKIPGLGKKAAKMMTTRSLLSKKISLYRQQRRMQYT
ncbi:hypothetical protein [Bacillus sp. JCM 19041]|uniref:hypothetical protein n=1 Tax=Bacillus sp. JCM 19041 TaxID=1460637 RepID=UPI0006D2359B